MEAEQIELLKKSVLAEAAVRRIVSNTLPLQIARLRKDMNYWLGNARNAIDCGETQLAKDCIGRCLLMLGLE